MVDEKTEKLANKIIGLAIKVHKKLGPPYSEKIYQRALYVELKNENIRFEREKEIRVKYDGINLGKQILDFVIDNRLVLELKKVEKINDVHKAQLLSYLKATRIRLGLLLNFGQGRLEIKRIIV